MVRPVTLCYQNAMTDNRNNDGRGPRKPGGGRSPGRPGRPGGDSPRGPRTSSGDKPFRKREDGERTFKPRAEGDSRPPRRDSDKPFQKREGGERTFRPRTEGDSRPPRRDGDKPFQKREGGERTFRPRAGGDSRPPRRDGDKPFQKREGGERTFRPRTEGDSRPPRRDGDKPFQKRQGGERTFRPRAEGDARPPRRDGDKPFRKREDNRPARAPQEPAVAAADVKPNDDAQRIAKVMARAGLCSRRDAELWIEAGRVMVNGVVLTGPALNVKPDDVILVDGKPLAERERTRLFLFHKPRGYVTTDRDPEGRQTIFEAMPEGLPRVVTVGRLDINTEGLLLLTNDGGLARILELPSTGWLRRYRVRAKGTTNQAVLDELRKGVAIDGIEYAGIEAALDREQGANVWLTMGLREGKNREVKRVLEHIGLEVNRLIRISFGPFQLLDLVEGAVEEVPTRILRDQLGPALAAEAGVDFDGPVMVEEPRSERIAARPAGRTGRDSRPARPPGRGDRDDRPQRSERGGDRRGRAPETEEEEVRPRVDRPTPGPRKHISILRAERRAEAKSGDRKRIERTETSDRKGRSVKIERVVAPASAEKPDTRNGRRFTRERSSVGDQPPRRRERPAGANFGRPGAGRDTADREDFRGPRPERKDRKNRFGGEGERARSDDRPRDDDRPKSYAARSSAGRPASASRPATGRAPGKGGKPFGKPGGGRSGGKPGGSGPRPGGRGPGRGRD